MKHKIKTFFALGVVLLATPLILVVNETAVYARAPLCVDGRKASDDEGCQSQYGIDAVDSATQERCDGFSSVSVRLNCINDPSISDGRNDTSPSNSDLVCDDGQEGVQLSTGECIPTDNETDLSENPIIVYLGRIINFLMGGIGIVMVAVIVWAGYDYMTSQGDPQQVEMAKKRISLAVTGIIMYILSFGLINWLIPGGLL